MAVLTGNIDPDSITSSVDLYANYREMAIANGVSPDEPALMNCRSDRPRFEVTNPSTAEPSNDAGEFVPARLTERDFQAGH